MSEVEVEYYDKMFPAATHDDQEAILNEEAGNPIAISTPPFSSPDPATDGLRMIPVVDDNSAADANVLAANLRDTQSTGDYDSMKAADLKSLVEERGLESEGNKKQDHIDALRADDASDMKASDFIEQIKAAQDQDTLDAVLALYEAQDRTLSSVEAAAEKKQDELNNNEQ